MVRVTRDRVEDAELVGELFQRLGTRFPWLHRERYGEDEVSPYRVGNMAGVSRHHYPFEWLTGRRRPNLRHMMNILREVMDSYEEELSSLKGKLATLEEKPSSLKGKLATLEEKPSSLKGKLATLEEEPSSLKVKLATLAKGEEADG